MTDNLIHIFVTICTELFQEQQIAFLSSESSKVPKKQLRIQDNVNYYDKEPSNPFQAPKWTISGYSGTLKEAVQAACMKRSSTNLPRGLDEDNVTVSY